MRAFPAGTAPVPLDDDGTTSAQMGRGTLRVRVNIDTTAVDLVTCHLKSKLLNYPGIASTRATKANARATPDTRSHCEPRRPSPCATTPPDCWTAKDSSAP